MSMHKNLLKSAILVASVLMSPAVFAQGAPTHFGFGKAVTPQDLAGQFAIPPDGRGLPPGSGTAAVGAKVFAENCAACHGDKLEGNPADRRVDGPDAVRPRKREENPDAASRLSIEKARIGNELAADPLPHDESESTESLRRTAENDNRP